MELFVALGVVVVAVCYLRPRLGLLATVGAGFIQDPIRKLVPGEPVAFVLGALILFGSAAAGFMSKGGVRVLRRSETAKALGRSVAMMIALVAAQSAHSFVRSENVVLPAIGFFSYAAPVVAGAVGFLTGLRRERLLQFLSVYSWLGLVAGVTVLVARYFPDERVFRSVGAGMMVYGEGFGVFLSSGILRTPEVASWHAATTACVIVVLVSLRGGNTGFRKSVLLGSASVACLILAVLWTGRRKALVEIVLFIVIFGALLVRLRGGSKRVVFALALGGALLAYQLVLGGWSAGTSREAAYLLQRGGTTTTEGQARLVAALSTVPTALSVYGVFGLGTGVAAQGAQYFGGDPSIGWIAEPGVGRVTAELGLFGLILAGWLAIRLGRLVRRRLGGLSRNDQETATLGLGLFAILVANGVVFVTAAQIFGDPFVYLMLGTLTGGLLGMTEPRPSDRVTGLVQADVARHTGECGSA